MLSSSRGGLKNGTIVHLLASLAHYPIKNYG